MRPIRHSGLRLIKIGVSMALLSLILVACGTTRNASVGFRSCPRRIQENYRTHSPHKPTGGMIVPADPLAGQVCVYSNNKGAPSTLRFSVRLPRARAHTLAMLLNQRGGRGYSCDAGHPVFIRLRYESNRMRSTRAVGCSPELASTAAGFKVLSPKASAAISGLIDPPLAPGGRTTRVPDLIGRPLAAAADAFKQLYRSSGQYAAPVEEVQDPRVPFGRVIWQVPLPGSPQGAGQVSAEFFVAVNSSSPCQAGQLRARFQNGGALPGGEHVGIIEVFDTSTRPCSLRGPITVHGLSASGQADTKTVSETVKPALALSPGTTLQTVIRDRAAALIANLEFLGDMTSNPAGGPCRPHETVPHAWTLTLGNGGTLQLANHTLGGPDYNGSRFFTCHGFLEPAPGKYADVTLLDS